MEKNSRVALTRRGNNSLMKHETSNESFVRPVADIYESSDAFVVKLDLPGVGKESISIHLSSDRLAVKGVAWPFHKEGASMLFREIRSKSYFREFKLGDGIDGERVDASFEDGVLTITLHKEERLKAKEIPIK